MTFTFDEDLGDDLSLVRDLIQDIDEDYPLLSDESILREISLTSSNLLLAASACCRKLAARFAVKVNFTVGRKSKNNSDLYTHFAQLAKDLEAKASEATFDETLVDVGIVEDTISYPEGLKHGNESEISWL